MGGAGGYKIYICLQFAGFMLQIFPVLLLFFSPYRQEDLRVSKKKLLICMSFTTVAVSVFSALMLGGCFYYGGYELQARLFGNLIFAAYLLVGSVIYFLVLKKTAVGRLLTYLMVLQYAVFLYLFAEAVDKYFPFLQTYTPYPPTTVLLYAVATAATWPFFRNFLKKNGPERFKNVNPRSLLLITVSAAVMLAVTVCSLQMEVVLDDIQMRGQSNVYLSIWLVCMIAIGLLVYVIYFRCLQIEEEKADINMRLAASEMQFTALDEKIQEDRKISHNIRHHFRTLAALAETERYGELQGYLKRYMKEWEDLSERHICCNPMINSILAYYVSQAEKNNIHIEADINIGEYYPFGITDMTVLLGNAMENALEACAHADNEKPFIWVAIKQFRKFFLIQIENSCRRGGNPARNGERVNSTKKGRNSGYGIASMEMIAKKYQGSLEYWSENDKFILRVVLNIPERDSSAGTADR